MAFLTYSDIATLLPANSDSNYISAILAMLEDYLSGLGFVFSLTPNASFKIYPKYRFQNTFYYEYFSLPTTVSIKNEEDVVYSESLTIRKDYELTAHHKIDTAYFCLTLKNKVIDYPYYLELNTSIGFASTVPDQWKLVIAELVKQALSIKKSTDDIYSNGGQEVKSTSIDGVSVSLATSNEDPTSDKIKNLFASDSAFQMLIKSYLVRL